MKVHGIFVYTKSVVVFHTTVVCFSHQSHVHLVDSHKPLLDSKAICFLLYNFTAAAAAKLLQSCPTLCDPIDGSPPGSPVPGILQARTLERGAISFSSGWKWKVKVKSLSCVQLFTTPWTACSLPGSSVHGIFQVRVLEWGAIAFSSITSLPGGIF